MTTGKIVTLQDGQNVNIYPETAASAVYLENGKTLEESVITYKEATESIVLNNPDMIQKINDIESGLNGVNSQLEQNKKHIDFSTYNVKDYGAKGDGVTDDWNAINTVIEIIKNTGGTIFFPTGVYAISKPLEIRTDDNVLLHNIVFKGVESNIPYIHSYGENPNKLAMNSNIIPTENFVGSALIIFNRVANTLVSDLALIGAKTNQSPRTIKGILYNYTNLVSNNSVRNCAIYRFTTGIDGYYAPILKVEFTNVQYCKNEGIVIRGDSRIVECEISLCGVNLSGASGEMSTKEIFQPSGYYGGTGIKVIDNAGNTNIIGGLIDWNCKGIVADGASGLIINGTRFHHNAEQHIYIRSKANSLGACGFDISGCRFLGGGFLTGTLGGKCAINITNENTFLQPIYGNISSNVFRYGDWDATENSDSKLSSPTATSGSLNSAILVTTNCDVDLTISANDMINCATNGAIGVTQTSSDKVSKIKLYGTNYNKIGWTSGTVRVYEEPNKSRANNKPSFIGVNGETTKNVNVDIYAWDNYIYSTTENMWRGINQRNIKYDTTQNRPVRDGYVDRGYLYFDTSLNKMIIWDGAVWRDFNGLSV